MARIGTIEGTMAASSVVLEQADPGLARATVFGSSGSQTVLEAPVDAVRLDGLAVGKLDTEVTVTTPSDHDGPVWVEATDDRLRITLDQPEGVGDDE